MIETKIKCDGHRRYTYDTPKPTELSEAIADGWYEIEVRPGSILIRQPKTTDSFTPTFKHACCEEHARRIIEAAALELIPDVVKKEPSTETETSNG